MVDMFDWSCIPNRILDPGAGEGALSLAMLDKLVSKGIKAPMYLVEIDGQVFKRLKGNCEDRKGKILLRMINGDFIKEAFRLRDQGIRFSHVIMNPPYFKLQRCEEQSDFLMSCGVNATNIYTAFIWLSALLLEDRGQIVAIVPRSFCNGPYFIKFREFITSGFSIDRIHSFDSRDSVFSKDQVLQENIIIKFSRKAQTNTVKVSYSTDQRFTDVRSRDFPSEDIISISDEERTISIPAYELEANIADFAGCTLTDLNLSVSTGPVVDFRLKESISKQPVNGGVPLLYSAHMVNGEAVWPVEDLKKKGQYYCPQPSLWDDVNDSSSVCDKNVSPAEGYYVVTRRFSSREEKRRVYASVVDSSALCPRGVAFENHLNYYHRKKHGFSKELAYGLAAYLNSPALDEHFRSFSGHTQVNATDLRNIPYPSLEQLRLLGRELLGNNRLCTQVDNHDLAKVCK
jgi:adenine-specific DNA-methyltransferase